MTILDEIEKMKQQKHAIDIELNRFNEEKQGAIKPLRLTDEIKKQRIIGNINQLFNNASIQQRYFSHTSKEKLLDQVRNAGERELAILYNEFGKLKRVSIIDLANFTYHPDEFVSNRKRISEWTRDRLLSRIAQYERSPGYSPESKGILTNLKEKIEKEPYFRPKCSDDIDEFLSSVIDTPLKDKKEDMIKEKAREVAEQKAAKKAKSYFEGISKKKEFFKHMKRI